MVQNWILESGLDFGLKPSLKLSLSNKIVIQYIYV